MSCSTSSRSSIATRPAMLDPDFYDAVITNGGMILAIDGVQPETGNTTLYVLQDVLTEKVLYADYLENGSNENIIIPLLEGRSSACGDTPVIAVVSDHQHSIRLAVAKVFPGVPPSILSLPRAQERLPAYHRYG